MNINLQIIQYFISLKVLLSLLNVVIAQDAQNTQQSLRELGLFNVIQQVLRPQNPQQNQIFDFIVVGGGAAGSVVANRLSENSNWQVALMEAGGTENIAHTIPSFASFFSSTGSNWNYTSVPQKRACFGMYNNVCLQPRGKILGGCSSINFMIYNRGNRRDFDKWADLGNHGWSYNELLPYFLKTEGATLNGQEFSPYHNNSGPLSVEYSLYRSEIANAFVLGAQEAGHPLTDYNGESQIGVSYVQGTIKNGRRHSAYRAFIEPIMNVRPNLKIFLFSKVIKVLIDPSTKVAYGIEFIFKDRLYRFLARKEVILSAGNFNSPQLLMLSGIGPHDVLEQIGVPIIKKLPVGVRMYDHMSHFGPTFITNTTGQTAFTTPEFMVPALLNFFAGRADTALSSLNSVEALTFIKTPGSTRPKDWPDVELIFSSGSFASDGGTGLKRGANIKDEIYNRMYLPLEQNLTDHFSVLVMPFNPRSIGRVWLNSSDHRQWPMIDPNYFDDPHDVEVMLQGIKAAIAITETPSMKRIGTRLLNIPIPGCEHIEFASDDYWRCSIRTLSYTLHHQVATCRMGPAKDSTTVVSPELRVHGISKLRVIDIGIIPFPISAHTNAVAFMIGEKGADMIKSTWDTTNDIN